MYDGFKGNEVGEARLRLLIHTPTDYVITEPSPDFVDKEVTADHSFEMMALMNHRDIDTQWSHKYIKARLTNLTSLLIDDQYYLVS